jgi:hypothetical protein
MIVPDHIQGKKHGDCDTKQQKKNDCKDDNKDY